jgi:putative aldouronate transport system permease protein
LKRSNRIKLSARNVVFHIFNNIFLFLCLFLVAVPLVNVLSQSLSSPSAVLNGKVTLLPVDFTVKSYGYVFRDDTIMTGYANSILYTVVGTVIAVVMTVLAAYPLTRKKLHGQKFFLFLFTFTMLFGGGMIPTYLVIKDLGMIDKIWALVIPNAISIYNMIIARTFFMNTIPYELYEAAEIDGANDFTVFFRIVIPLSGSILAVLTLFYAVGLWNMYFDALIYINTSTKYPLQLVLRNIMTSARVQSQMVQATGVVQSTEMLALTESLKYTTIVCASVPVLALYPFIQKHFTKGVMIGTLKG